nr:MAG TPA: hypothetical protein [Caudoviricetes sp.]
MLRIRMRMSARVWKSNKSAYSSGDVSPKRCRGEQATATAPEKVES